MFIASHRVAACAALMVAAVTAGCHPRSSAVPPAGTPAATVAPQTYVVGSSATDSSLTVLSIDANAGTLAPALTVRRPDGSRTVSANVALVDRSCSPGVMTVTGKQLEVVCNGSKLIDLLTLTPGPNNTLVIDPASVKTCPTGNDPWLLRAADIDAIDGTHVAVDVLDRTSGALSLCINNPSGFHAMPTFSLPVGQVPRDFRLVRAPTGSGYPYYEAISYSTAGGGGVSFYGVAENGTRVRVGQVPFATADLPVFLDDDCDVPTLGDFIAAGPRNLWYFQQPAVDAPFVLSPLANTGVPFYASSSGPSAPNQIGHLRLGTPRLTYHAFAATGTLDLFDANYKFLTGGAMPAPSLRLRGASGMNAGYFVSLSAPTATTSTFSTFKFDGTTLSAKSDFTLNYHLMDFSLARIGFPTPTPTPAATPTPGPTASPGASATPTATPTATATPGTVGNVVLNPSVLIFDFPTQTKSFTATQVGNPNNIFTNTQITCPSGNNGRGTITQTSNGTFTARADATSSGLPCTAGITGLQSRTTNMQFVF